MGAREGLSGDMAGWGVTGGSAGRGRREGGSKPEEQQVRRPEGGRASAPPARTPLSGLCTPSSQPPALLQSPAPGLGRRPAPLTCTLCPPRLPFRVGRPPGGLLSPISPAGVRARTHRRWGCCGAGKGWGPLGSWPPATADFPVTAWASGPGSRCPGIPRPQRPLRPPTTRGKVRFTPRPHCGAGPLGGRGGAGRGAWSLFSWRP